MFTVGKFHHVHSEALAKVKLSIAFFLKHLSLTQHLSLREVWTELKIFLGFSGYGFFLNVYAVRFPVGLHDHTPTTNSQSSDYTV